MTDFTDYTAIADSEIASIMHFLAYEKAAPFQPRTAAMILNALRELQHRREIAEREIIERWHAAGEAEPPKGEWLLAWCAGRPAIVAYMKRFGYAEFFVNFARGEVAFGVTHWRLISAPPSAEADR